MIKQGKANLYFEKLTDAKDSTWTRQRIEAALDTKQNGYVVVCIWTNDMAILHDFDELLFSKRPDIELVLMPRWTRDLSFGYDEQGKAIPEFFEKICMTMVENLSQMKHIKRLDVDDSQGVKSVELLANMTQLESLELTYRGKKVSLAFLSNLVNLKNLAIGGNCTDMQTIGDCTKLESIKITGAEGGGKMMKAVISDLTFLAKLPELRSLTMDICKIEGDMSPIGDLPKLQYLALGNANIDNLNFISACTTLETLVLHRLTATQLCDLTNLTSLKMLSLEHSKSMSVEALTTAENLKYLQIEGMKSVKNKELAEMVMKMPNLEALQYDWAVKLSPLFAKFGINIEMSHHVFDEFDPTYKAFYLRMNLY